ncbi:MAG TPA: hypothetical protein VK675_04895 [Candidatus Paceibacterota bacterium]|nr:hypothetical protein [Candidatus Paceibacterota bacterium]
MKFRFLLLSSISILAIFAVSVSLVNAQSANDVLVNMAPDNPAPYENTTITLNSFVSDLDSVLISWSVNGKTITSAIGKKSFSTTAPAAGSETIVVATVSLPSGPMNVKITIKPSVMVLLWQAVDSYVPSFYKGKALPTESSKVKVVAMPEVKTSSGIVSPQNMTYAWKKDYTPGVDGSGYGKNFFLYSSDYLEDSNNISVVASTVDQQSSSDASIDIATSEPKILFYKNDTNIGTIWQNSLPDTHKIQGPEVVEAIPYFISPKEIRNPELVWSWFINDDPVYLTTFRQDLMPLSVPQGTHGTSKLRLDISNDNKIFEAASKEINVEF